MAKQPNLYFAVKLVAPSVGKKQMFVETPAIVDTTTHCMDDNDDQGKKSHSKSRFLRIGETKSHVFHGIAGHFMAGVLDFTDAEDKQCKTIAEAERLVRTRHKAWLADAYDWFVMPGYVHDAPASAAKSAKGTKPAKTPKAVKAKVSKSVKSRSKK